MKKHSKVAYFGLKEMFSNRNIILMTITVTMFHFSMNLLLPWWPLYLKELGASIEIIGVLFTVQGIVKFLMMIPGGMLADRYGRRKIILIGHVFRLMSPVLYLLATTWQQLIPGMVIYSLSMIYQPAIYSITLESLPEKSRVTGFGVIQMILLLATSFTAFMGGVLMDVWGVVEGMKIIFFIFLIFEVIRFTLRFLFLSETLKTKKPSAYDFRKSLLPSNLQLTKGVWAMLAARCLFEMGFRMSNPFIVVYVTDKIGFTKTQWGLLQMCFLMVFALVSVPGGLFANRFSNRRAIFLSGIIAPIPLFSYIFLRDFNLILMINIIYGFGAGLGGVIMGGGPAWQAMIADLVPPERRGRVMGLMSSVAGTFGSTAPTIGGFLWTGFAPTATLFSAAMLETVSALVFYMFTKERA